MNSLDYGYGIGASDVMDATMASTGMSVLFIGIVLFSLILSLIQIISYWKIFQKAGKPGWASIVPIYNTVVKLEIAGMSVISILLFLIPIVNIFIIFKMNINIAKKFDKSTGFGVGLTLIPIIFAPILGFSDSKSEGKTEETNVNDFNAMNVINEQQSTIEPEVNVAPTVEMANIEVENNVQSELNNNSISTNEINEVPLNNINEVPLQNVNEIPVVEEIKLDGINENTNEAKELNSNLFGSENETNVNDNNVYVNNKPINNVVNEIPVINNQAETEVIKPSNENLGTKNSNISINSEVQDINVKEDVPVSNINVSQEVPNAFNSKPIIENNNEVNISQNINQNEIETLNNVVNEPINIPNISETNSNNMKKVCKNCGAEMPNIVSVCPSCGTDNE